MRAGPIRRQLRPPRADFLEGIPELGLLLLLVERRIDVGHDERVDRRREALQLSESRLDATAEWEVELVTKRSVSSPITTISFG
jgi:hypothetical protein